MEITQEELAAIDFAKKWKIPLDPGKLLDIHCGLHSGFPDCCIIHFSLFVTAIMDSFNVDCINAGYKGGWTGKLDYFQKFVVSKLPQKFTTLQAVKWHVCEDSHVQYARCPACIVQDKIVEFKDCDCKKTKYHDRLIHWLKIIEFLEQEKTHVSKSS
ncbi:MAG: hypothetical protein DWQ19_10260 [Crenarchaeota archaeon]|nr:MAG: hypothetical protein DWQ19_10260 [Thermoproteota archaeon]